MANVSFVGGPLDGQMGGDPAAMMGGLPPEEPPAESEADLFRRVMADVRALLQLSTISEQNKLSLSKAETLLQQIKAAEEKDDEAAMGGKLTPGVLRKLGGGGGGY